MARLLLDTNVLSKIFYGDVSIKEFVDENDCIINSVIYIECLQGSIGKREKTLIKRSIDHLTCLPITPEISTKAVELIDQYSSSQGLFLADSMIAATALVHNLDLVTFNSKDFKFIKSLKLVRP